MGNIDMNAAKSRSGSDGSKALFQFLLDDQYENCVGLYSQASDSDKEELNRLFNDTDIFSGKDVAETWFSENMDDDDVMDGVMAIIEPMLDRENQQHKDPHKMLWSCRDK